MKRLQLHPACKLFPQLPEDDLEQLADDSGLPVDENRKLAAELRALRVSVGEDVIPSIRCIQEIE